MPRSQPLPPCPLLMWLPVLVNPTPLAPVRWPLGQAPLGCSPVGLLSAPFLTGTLSPGCPLASVSVAVASVPHPDSRSPSCPERWLRRISQAPCAPEGRQSPLREGGCTFGGDRQRHKPVEITSLTVLMAFPFPPQPKKFRKKSKE